MTIISWFFTVGPSEAVKVAAFSHSVEGLSLQPPKEPKCIYFSGALQWSVARLSGGLLMENAAFLLPLLLFICVFIALAGERSPEVTCPLSAAAPFSSVDCNRLTHWPRLVKQHAKSCLPPVAVCEECSKLRPLFSFFFSPAGQACPSSLCSCVSKAKAADTDPV